MKNPIKGDIVLLTGRRAKVIDLASRMTNNGLATLYHVKFLGGTMSSSNCLREEFTFPIPPDRPSHY